MRRALRFRALQHLFLCLAPLRAPELVGAHNASSSTLEVEWIHLPEEHFRGEPIGYIIKYYPVESEGDFNVVSVKYRTNTVSLTNLSIYTMYVIILSAESSGGIGPANTIEARTDAEGTWQFFFYIYICIYIYKIINFSASLPSPLP